MALKKSKKTPALKYRGGNLVIKPPKGSTVKILIKPATSLAPVPKAPQIIPPIPPTAPAPQPVQPAVQLVVPPPAPVAPPVIQPVQPPVTPPPTVMQSPPTGENKLGIKLIVLGVCLLAAIWWFTRHSGSTLTAKLPAAGPTVVNYYFTAPKAPETKDIWITNPVVQPQSPVVQLQPVQQKIEVQAEPPRSPQEVEAVVVEPSVPYYINNYNYGYRYGGYPYFHTYAYQDAHQYGYQRQSPINVYGARQQCSDGPRFQRPWASPPTVGYNRRCFQGYGPNGIGRTSWPSSTRGGGNFNQSRQPQGGWVPNCGGHSGGNNIRNGGGQHRR